MYAQPSFLTIPNENLRKLRQIEGFQTPSYWFMALEMLKKEMFIIPELELSLEMVDKLSINQYLRLGNRLERYFSFIIDQTKRYEVLLENYQVIQNKVTLGELDFILKDINNQEVIHVELGAKLYLYDPNKKVELDRWVGPNRRDNLIKKLDKLKQVQLPLLYDVFTQNELLKKGIKVDKQMICLKVRLFLPWRYSKLPMYADPHNVFGYYVDSKLFMNESYFKKHLFFMPEKQDWVVNPEHGEVWFSHNEIISQVQSMHNHNQSPLLWLRKEDNTYETIFVTFW